MGFLSLEDSTSDVEVTIFPNEYVKYHDLLKNGNLLLINGKLDLKDDKKSFIVNEVKEMKIDE